MKPQEPITLAEFDSQIPAERCFSLKLKSYSASALFSRLCFLYLYSNMEVVIYLRKPQIKYTRGDSKQVVNLRKGVFVSRAGAAYRTLLPEK